MKARHVGGPDALRQLSERLTLAPRTRERRPPTDLCALRSREVAPRHLQQRRHGAKFRVEIGGLCRRERGDGIQPRAWPDRIVVQLDGAVNRRPFLRGRVALGGDHRRVVRRIASEGLEYTQVVLQAVHFSAHQVAIDLLADRPSGGGDVPQALLQALKCRSTPGVGRGGVVRNTAVDAGRLLECPPFLEQRHELLIRGGRCLRSAHRGLRDGEGHDGERQRQSAGGCHAGAMIARARGVRVVVIETASASAGPVRDHALAQVTKNVTDVRSMALRLLSTCVLP